MHLHVIDTTTGQWVPVTSAMLGGGGGGGVTGDASAANQATQIELETEIRNRLPLTPHSQPLTDTQLRAAAVPVSAASLPLPAGAATEATLAAVSAKLPATLGAKSAAQSLAVTLAADGAGVSALTSIAGMAVPAHDHIALGYTGDNLTTVTYKTGGSGGTTVATLTLAYSGSTLTSITRS